MDGSGGRTAVMGSSGFRRPTVRGVCQDGTVHSEMTGAAAAGVSGKAQVQNVKSARVYVFGEADVTDDEVGNSLPGSSHEMSELRARGKNRRQYDSVDQQWPAETEREDNYFEKSVSEGETLQKLALKYGCQVSELKRINNLIQDQDFHGLKVVRIPLRHHGLLTELIQEEEEQLEREKWAVPGASGTSAHASTINMTYDANEEDDDSNSETQQLLVRTLSIRDSLSLSHQGKKSIDFLKKMDSDIKSIIESTNSRKDTLEEVRDTLTCKRIHPLIKRKSILDGADCGMRWWSAVLLMLALGFIAPLLFLLYYEYVKTKSSLRNNTHV